MGCGGRGSGGWAPTPSPSTTLGRSTRAGSWLPEVGRQLGDRPSCLGSRVCVRLQPEQPGKPGTGRLELRPMSSQDVVPTRGYGFAMKGCYTCEKGRTLNTTPPTAVAPTHQQPPWDVVQQGRPIHPELWTHVQQPQSLGFIGRARRTFYVTAAKEALACWEAAEHQTRFCSILRNQGEGNALQKRKLVQCKNEIIKNKRDWGHGPAREVRPQQCPCRGTLLRLHARALLSQGPLHSRAWGPMVPPGLQLGRQFGVAGRGELALQVLEDVEREAADYGDGRHLPHEGHCCDKGHVCRGETQEGVRQAGREATGHTYCAPPGGAS